MAFGFRVQGLGLQGLMLQGFRGFRVSVGTLHPLTLRFSASGLQGFRVSGLPVLGGSGHL